MFQKQAPVLTLNNPDLRVALCFPPLSPLISLRNLKFSKRTANLYLPMESLLNHVIRPCIRTNYKPSKQGLTSTVPGTPSLEATRLSWSQSQTGVDSRKSARKDSSNLIIHAAEVTYHKLLLPPRTINLSPNFSDVHLITTLKMSNVATC